MEQGNTALTLNLLQKSPEAGRLLVRLHDKHTLYGLSKDRKPEARAELATIMAELLDITLAPAESEMITDVLMSLMRQAGVDLKRAVSERLASMEVAPLRLIVHLANEKIAVAEPILKRSRVLDDMDLAYIVQSHKEDHWQAIAQRAELSNAVIDMLADTHDLDTAIHLTENKNILLTDHAMGTFTTMSQISEDLARPLLTRTELPRLLDHYTPSDNMISEAEERQSSGLLTIDSIVSVLRRGEIARFTAMFSVYCGLPIDVVKGMIIQESAQGLAIACRATGILKADFINMYLLTSRLRGENIIDHSRLDLALKYFDKIKEPVARHILNQSRNS